MTAQVTMVTRLLFSVLWLASLGAAQEFFPLNQVHAGLHGVGRTVFQGEEIAEFQVEVLGVLTNLGPTKPSFWLGSAGVLSPRRVYCRVSAGVPFTLTANCWARWL